MVEKDDDSKKVTEKLVDEQKDDATLIEPVEEKSNDNAKVTEAEPVGVNGIETAEVKELMVTKPEPVVRETETMVDTEPNVTTQVMEPVVVDNTDDICGASVLPPSAKSSRLEDLIVILS